VEQSQVLLALIGAASLGIVATLFILRRQRKDAEAAMPQESRFAASTEGEKICPHCGMGNLWTDSRCVSCRRPLR
jgi:LPXTG-motif cell wall-anchored protein